MKIAELHPTKAYPFCVSCHSIRLYKAISQNVNVNDHFTCLS